MKKFIIIDGAGLVYRSFFALPQTLKNEEGLTTNAVLGFTNILLNLLFAYKPDFVCIAFDKKGPTFRHKIYSAYKATRVKPPQTLYDQIPYAKKVAEAFGIPVFEVDDYEADDVIATIVKKIKDKRDFEALVVTSDFDLFQVVSENVKILYPEKGFSQARELSSKEVVEKYGVKPEQVTDYKALKGDASDNLPGVRGIGEVTAKGLIKKFGSLENIYKHLAEIPEAVRKKLEEHKKSAFLSKMLAVLKSDVSLEFELEKCEVKQPDKKRVGELFLKLGFKKLLQRLEPIFQTQPKLNLN